MLVPNLAGATFGLLGLNLNANIGLQKKGIAMSRYFSNKLQDYHPGMKEDIRPPLSYISSLISDICANVEGMPTDGGMYVGSAGVAYMLWYVSTQYPNAKNIYLDMALKIYNKYKKESAARCHSKQVSFILDEAGVFLLGALIGRSLKQEDLVIENAHKFRSLAQICLKTNFNSHSGGDELFVGRAGYLCGALNFESKLGIKVIDDETKNAICEKMWDSGKRYYVRHKSHFALMYAYYETEYLGAAHGLSSILQMMISCPSYLSANPQASSDIRRAIDKLLSTQLPNGNFVPATDELGYNKNKRATEDELVHWCHGAPGVIYLFAKAYKLWGDEKYLQACLKCGELTWQKGLLRKGPGICHGVAGNGYVFLVLYQLTGDPKHLHRAHQFANFMQTQEFRRGSRTPDSPYSLFEGTAGTVCFLLDCLQPDKAEFPFFSIN